nr:MAG TPA: hypothetical protein [Caudoviricetes sp.]DAW03679.1 MAG TPA: hypothetical protein [Caudoviricetes sp.]
MRHPIGGGSWDLPTPLHRRTSPKFPRSGF